MTRRRGKIHGIQRNVRHQKLHQKQRQSTNIRTKLQAISEIAAKLNTPFIWNIPLWVVVKVFYRYSMYLCSVRAAEYLCPSLFFNVSNSVCFYSVEHWAVSEHYRCCAGIVCPVCWCSLCLAVCMYCPLWPNVVCVQCGNVCLIPSWSSDICGRVLSRRAVPAVFCVFVLCVIVSVFKQSIVQ